MSHTTGFSYAEAACRWPELPGRAVCVGGVTGSFAEAAAALEALAAAGGIMVRQVLAAIGSPFACCDYHAAADPYRVPARDQRACGPGGYGRGAAGRPATKAAFMVALAEALQAAADAEPARHYAADLEAAWEAFGSDSGYAAAMASAAVTVLEREHAARQKTMVSQAVHQALSACDARRGEFTCHAVAACGTGDCRFAAGPLALVRAPAPPGRTARPVNHERAGEGFGTAVALAGLAALSPFLVAVRVASADCVTGADRTAADSTR